MLPRYSEKFYAHNGRISDKWEQYLPVYDREFARFIARGNPVRLLEIGVQNGGSLEIWGSLLPPGSTIVGIDINPACASLHFDNPNIRVLILDASDLGALNVALGDAEFDIILDDGSHLCSHVVSTFKACFPRLAAGGIYIVEDLHTSYWVEFGGGFRAAQSSIEWLKGLIDSEYTDYFQNPEGIADLRILKELNRHIRRITFHDSVAIIEKWPQPKEVPHKRVITGTQASVIEPTLVAEIDLAGEIREITLTTQALDATVKQLKHDRDKALVALEEERAHVLRMQAQIQSADKKISELETHVYDLKNSKSWRLTAPFRAIMSKFRDRP